MIFEPKPFAVAALKQLLGAIVEIRELVFRGLWFLRFKSGTVHFYCI
jgi:hypothetical protein